MAEHGITMSLSSDDDSSDHDIPHTITPIGASGGSSSHRNPPIPVGYHLANVITPPSKKPRGRPPGSKNKPKPPLVITQDNEQAMKAMIIEIPAGADVVETLVQFAHRRHVGITILSASGSVSNVTLCHPLSHSPAFTLHGPFTLMALTGTYINAPPPHSWPHCSSFGIYLNGNQGQIFGGIIAGKVLAHSAVTLVASVFKNPEFHKLGGVNDGGDGDNNPNEQGGNDGISGFHVASPNPMNSPGDVNAMQMQWGGHGHPSSRPANY
ncbi:AT-hook motif nuclear-localized protein 17-like [Gastrolobium bilobum]|uniref:AT-hook motif nuclear-localized protein 17-like n=1 Tax=Gastrolobium bilobum TaxID=150636 RepID=UPI002AB2FAFE|nr:AT-hook motif nuclear-localized protein 17-like [Gastrolobium bilobum]